MENLVTVTIRSTHYYLIETGQGFFMVDTGWAGALADLQRELKRLGVRLPDVRYVMITHSHPDHAGLTQEIKQAAGARLVILETQIPFLPALRGFYKGKDIYKPISVDPGDLVLGRENRTDLKKIGVLGEIVETPGHSDDSVSLVLDSGMAFVGDLHPPDFVEEGARDVTCQSWKKLVERGVKMIFPSHADPFPAERISRSLGDC